jgi:competence protein ComEC
MRCLEFWLSFARRRVSERVRLVVGLHHSACWLKNINWPRLNEQLAAHRQALFAYWPVCFGIGIAWYFCLDQEPSFAFVVFATALITVIGMAALYTARRHDKIWLYFLAHSVLAVALGFGRGSFQTYLQVHHADTHFVTAILTNQSFDGIVESAEQTKTGGHRYVFSVKQWHTSTGTALSLNTMAAAQGPVMSAPTLPHTVRLKAKAAFDLQPGDHVSCMATLMPISPPVSPYGYNFKRDHFFKGIGATGSVKACSVNTAVVSNDRPLAALRHNVTEKLRHLMHKPFGDIAAALITGDRSGIPQMLRQQFTDAGLAHILAISGLHMSLVAGLIFLMTRRIASTLHLGVLLTPRRRWIPENAPIREIAAILTIVAMLFYLGLSGYGYPAIRSFFMTSLVMLGVLFCRDPLSMRSLALAASIILLLFPESLLSASFQLSFSAVVALIAAYDLFGRRAMDWSIADSRRFGLKRLALYFFGIALTTIIATLATTPLSMAIFNRLTVQAILGNLVALPLTAFWIMPSAVLSAISLLWGGFQPFFTVFEWGIHLLCETAQYVAALPGSGLLVPTPSDAFYGFFALGGICLCLGPYRWVRVSGFVAVCASFLFFYKNHLPVGYFAHDRSVIALYDPPYLRVSSLKRGAFYVDQWRQHLAVPMGNVRLFDSQAIDWMGYHVVADPFKNVIDETLDSKAAKKRYLRDALRGRGHAQDTLKDGQNSRPHPLMTNSFVRYAAERALVTGDFLLQQGAAFVYADGQIVYERQLRKGRPWS